MEITVPEAVRTYITASNASDADAVMAAFADDAVVNDTRREFSGIDAIRAWLDREIIGDKVTMNVASTRTHHGLVTVDAVMDGNYDRTGLPDPLVLTFYFALAGDHISQLIIVHNQPTPIWADA
jgi:hypothetical protein